MLVCEEHKNDTINQDLLKQYVHRFIRNPSLPDFSRNLSLTEVPSDYHKISTQCIDRGIYLLQHINIDGQQYLVFFDNGCSDFVVSQEAVKKLGSRCTKESSNTVILGGVGNCQVESKLGTYTVKLPTDTFWHLSWKNYNKVSWVSPGRCCKRHPAKLYTIRWDTSVAGGSRFNWWWGRSNDKDKIPTLPSKTSTPNVN